MDLVEKSQTEHVMPTNKLGMSQQLHLQSFHLRNVHDLLNYIVIIIIIISSKKKKKIIIKERTCQIKSKAKLNISNAENIFKTIMGNKNSKPRNNNILKNKNTWVFGRGVWVMLFECFWYTWVKKCMEMCVNVFEMLKKLLKIGYQMAQC